MSRIRNIKELADLAGVSTGTVSRALAGSTLISLKTRERIQALAKEHGFRPNLLARNLRIQRTNTIGVLIPLGHETAQHLTDPFFITMLGLLADKLTERGYDLLLSRVIPTDSAWLDRIATSGRVDGLIVIGQSDQAATIDAVLQESSTKVLAGILAARPPASRHHVLPPLRRGPGPDGAQRTHGVRVTHRVQRHGLRETRSFN